VSAEKDYALGTHDEEILRLGLQHRVWRPATLDGWMRAGMTSGSRVIDIGAGPGYAALDAAEIVGPSGEVVAVERSERFISFAQDQAKKRGFSWVRCVQADLVEDRLELSDFDIAWCRWVACFVSSPQRLVQRIAASLRPGGRVLFHEYADYASWRVSPRSKVFEQFVAEVMASWRYYGGEPDIALDLPALLTAAGLKVISVRPIIHAIRSTDYMWQWPSTFVESGLRRLVELKRVDSDWADGVREAVRELEQNPDAMMMSPLVLELIAEHPFG
jgi:SAM-dependent methyltransferase